MSDITDFITALEAAQSKAKFTSEVQEAATGIDAATLKAAVEAALAMGESEKLSDDAQIAALKKGLDFAAKLVMMLKTAPGPFEKKDLWVYFKIGNNVVPEKPGMFDMVVCWLPWFWFRFRFCAECRIANSFSIFTEEAALRRVGQGQALQRPEGPGYLHPEGQRVHWQVRNPRRVKCGMVILGGGRQRRARTRTD
jgi:hypothetical protein